MKLLFILDPLDTLKISKDTSVAIMREAAARGYAIYVCQQHDIYLRNEQVYVSAAKINLKNINSNWYALEANQEALPSQFDAVLMRKDPPFDSEYLYSTYLLELAVNQGARVINNPSALRNWNEKLSITKFPEFTPEFIVTSRASLIRDFLSEHQDIVIKPLDGMGGSGVFRLTLGDPNIGVILETATHFETKTVMAQRYLSDISKGDKRILIINGVPVPYALARIPKSGETRGNLAAGGKGVAQALSARDYEIATGVSDALKQAGIFLAGLDVIGDYLTEINVTSPTCMVEIAEQTQTTDKPCNPAALFIDALEGICK